MSTWEGMINSVLTAENSTLLKYKQLHFSIVRWKFKKLQHILMQAKQKQNKKMHSLEFCIACKDVI